MTAAQIMPFIIIIGFTGAAIVGILVKAFRDEKDRKLKNDYYMRYNKQRGKEERKS